MRLGARVVWATPWGLLAINAEVFTGLNFTWTYLDSDNVSPPETRFSAEPRTIFLSNKILGKRFRTTRPARKIGTTSAPPIRHATFYILKVHG